MKNFRLLELMLVTDGSGDVDHICRVARAAVGGGVRAIQARESKLEDRDLLDLLRRLRGILPRGRGLVLVNDRLDLCVASGADGVHFGFRSYETSLAREILGPKRWIGSSVHHFSEIQKSCDADYFLFGPVFPTPSKKGILKARGFSGLSRALRAAPIPVLAVGGANPSNAEELGRLGCAGLAAIRALHDPSKPHVAARQMLERFRAGRLHSSRPESELMFR